MEGCQHDRQQRFHVEIILLQLPGDIAPRPRRVANLHANGYYDYPSHDVVATIITDTSSSWKIEDAAVEGCDDS